MKSIGEVYLHVGNSGVTFQVVDEGQGPTIIISTSSFGNLNHECKVYATTEGLKKIGEMFLDAASQGYSGEYVYPAYVPRSEGGSGQSHPETSTPTLKTTSKFVITEFGKDGSDA